MSNAPKCNLQKRSLVDSILICNLIQRSLQKSHPNRVIIHGHCRSLVLFRAGSLQKFFMHTFCKSTFFPRVPKKCIPNIYLPIILKFVYNDNNVPHFRTINSVAKKSDKFDGKSSPFRISWQRKRTKFPLLYMKKKHNFSLNIIRLFTECNRLNLQLGFKVHYISHAHNI
jgi:hypothetical protein